MAQCECGTQLRKKTARMCAGCWKRHGQRLYTKTPQGLLMMTYHNAKARVEGRKPDKAHLYAGLPIMARADFYAWALNDLSYRRLFKAWKRSGFVRRLTPSIHRINRKQGYVPGNVQFITLSKNSALVTRKAA